MAVIVKRSKRYKKAAEKAIPDTVALEAGLELLKQFAAECSDKCHPESQGFFKKVKKFFEEDSSRA